MRRLRSAPLLALVLVAGCAATVPAPELGGVVIPARDTVPKGPPPREPPPSPGTTRPFRFPRASWAELPGGLKVATLPARALPVVHVRVVIGAGRAADGEHPGLAAVTALLLRDGGAGALSARELSARVAALGADLTVDVGFDTTTLGLAVARDRLGEALDLLGAMVARPQLPAAELDRLVKREAERLVSAARASGVWGASMMLHRDLFSLPAEHHPYATWSATADEVRKLGVADCRAFHRRFYVPRNTFVVVAGDTAPSAVLALAGKAFAGFSGGEPPALSFTDPVPPEDRRITLVDHPGSPVSDVLVGALGPPREGRSFVAFTVASRILGGAEGRLVADLVEKRSLAAGAEATVTELAHAPSVLVAHVRAQAPRTGPALQALLEHLGSLSARAPDTEEVEAAARSLAGALTLHLDGPGTLAGALGRLRGLGLPDDHDDAFRKELGEITPALAFKAAVDHLRAGHEIVVVAGDAAVIGPALARFGEVKVVDPTREFARLRTLPMDASAPPEPQRQARR